VGRHADRRADAVAMLRELTDWLPDRALQVCARATERDVVVLDLGLPVRAWTGSRCAGSCGRSPTAT
jgi:hypothetical protein